MKKFWFRLAVYMLAVLAVAWGNNAVLLHFHPLEFYYTPTGILLTSAVMAVEALTLWPAGNWLFDRWIIPAEMEGLEEEKESIVTEFKED